MRAAVPAAATAAAAAQQWRQGTPAAHCQQQPAGSRPAPPCSPPCCSSPVHRLDNLGAHQGAARHDALQVDQLGQELMGGSGWRGGAGGAGGGLVSRGGRQGCDGRGCQPARRVQPGRGRDSASQAAAAAQRRAAGHCWLRAAASTGCTLLLPRRLERPRRQASRPHLRRQVARAGGVRAKLAGEGHVHPLPLLQQLRGGRGCGGRAQRWAGKPRRRRREGSAADRARAAAAAACARCFAPSWLPRQLRQGPLLAGTLGERLRMNSSKASSNGGRQVAGLVSTRRCSSAL